MRKIPLVSIIIVNFNGRSFLNDCLLALEHLKYPQGRLEIIVVDNNSSDDSVSFIKLNFPKVKLVLSESNAGFTGGNILGFQHSKGEYIVLLNNDVVVDSQWLNALVLAAADDKTGIVSSRLRFSIPFVELVLESKNIPKSKIDHSIDHSPVSILVEEIVCEDAYFTNQVFYKSGFYDKKKGEIVTRRSKGKSSTLLPFDLKKKENAYKLTIHGYELQEEKSIPIKLKIGGETIDSFTLEAFESRQLQLNLHLNQVKDHFIWLIQYAGNIVLHSGYSKDRGSLLDHTSNEIRQFYEEENAFYEKPADILAACGAACLIKRKLIDNVGFLDGHFFMYYEDIEFSLRAIRAGWKIIYEPKAIGYHRHRATTGDVESAFFLEYVERNHLAFVILHFPLAIAITEIILFLLRFSLTIVKCFVFQFRDNLERANTWRQRYEGRKAAFYYLTHSLPHLIQSRRQISRLWPMKWETVDQRLY